MKTPSTETSHLLPLPLREGVGGGVRASNDATRRANPPPYPPPQGGRGDIRRAALLVAIVSLATVGHASAQSSYDEAKANLQKRTAAERKAAAGNPDRKIWDFVVADRKAKTVMLLSCATGIKPTDPAEFFVNPLASGRDYESLAVTFATPADVRAALDFIGLKPGQPVDPSKDRYWPRGPRVVMTFTIAGKPVRAEALVTDAATGRPLPAAGLIYTGSYTYTDAEGKPHVAADESDARPLAPTYNDPAALFDVPAQAPQSAVYGSRKPSPAFTAKPGEAIDVTISPAHDEAAVEEWSAVVTADLIDGHARFAIQPFGPHGFSSAVRPTSVDDLAHFVSSVSDLANGRRDLFTAVHISRAVPVIDVRNLYAVLQAVEKDRGVKLDAPAAGELFHRAFFPDPQWRDRTNRLGEPWELFLTRGPAGTLAAKLERLTSDDAGPGGTKLESSAPADPAAFAKTIDAGRSQWSRTVFVYPPADLTYGELMTWVRPALATYPRVFVFPAETPTTQPSR